MGEYDIALKGILTRGDCNLLSRLTGLRVTRWISGELPDVRSQQADLLGETPEGRLVHVELQSANDSKMAARMLDYAAAIYRRHDRFPKQLVLYVGEAPLSMTAEVVGEDLSYRFAIVDFRELDGEVLLASDRLEDNLLGILARWSDQVVAVRRILAKIKSSVPESRVQALTELTILAKLRSLVSVLEEESKRMPITEDIMEHEIIGRERKFGMALGREEGREEGLVEGRVEGERRLVLRLLTTRFGKVPLWAAERIESFGLSELDAISDRLLTAKSLRELLA
jgi:predicted transposase YdaD